MSVGGFKTLKLNTEWVLTPAVLLSVLYQPLLSVSYINFFGCSNDRLIIVLSTEVMLQVDGYSCYADHNNNANTAGGKKWFLFVIYLKNGQ